MKSTTLAISFLFLLIGTTHAQVQGSPEAYDRVTEFLDRAMERQAKLDSAISLSTRPLLLGKDTLDINSLRTETRGVICEVLFTVQSIIDDKNVILTAGKQTIWASGFSTKGLVDGKDVVVRDVIEVTGTKAYPTVSGASKTVFVIAPASDEVAKDFQERIKTENKYVRKWKTLKSETPDGRLIAVTNDGVTIQYVNGNQNKLTIKFKEMDPEFRKEAIAIAKEFKKENAKKKTPTASSTP